MTHDEVIQHLQIYIKRIWHSDAYEPWGYVAPVVAAFVMRATGVRHIYLIYREHHVKFDWYLDLFQHPALQVLLAEGAHPAPGSLVKILVV